MATANWLTGEMLEWAWGHVKAGNGDTKLWTGKPAMDIRMYFARVVARKYGDAKIQRQSVQEAGK